MNRVVRAKLRARETIGHDVRVSEQTTATQFNFGFTGDQIAMRDLAAQIARDVYEPKATGWDQAGNSFPHEERKRLAGLGLLGMTLPEEYGGGNRPLIDALIVIEQIAKVCQLAAFPIFEACTGPARVIHLFGNEEQKARLLPPVASGDKTIAVAISEADAGSAATDMQTAAKFEGDQVVIDGVKRWCSGAGHAEQYLVYVRFGSEPGSAGLGAAIVDKKTVGLTFGPQENFMGFHGVGSADMFFDNVRIPRENLIVEKGGFRRLFTAFSIERLGNATMSLAIGQSCLDRSVAYVQERKQFGRELVDYQLVQATLADMIMQVEASRLLIYRAAVNAGVGAPIPLEASIAKCFANEMAKRVSDLAMQLHGGYGYTVEYTVERLHRDAHGWAIAGGTTNMQRLRIASEFLGRRFDQRAR
jgi:alkylation response protein AidB-like acyl-CoA dehydrogenase